MDEKSSDSDVTIHEVLRIVSKIADKQESHIDETNNYRRANDRLITAHKTAIQKNGEAIDCMREHFLKFEGRFTSDYEPMLKESSERRKWWNGIYQEQKKRSVLVVTGVIAVAALFGLGNAVLFLIKKFNVFMGSMLP
jgi:hypothetical protein